MRILLADDSVLLRSGLASMLTEMGQEIVGEAGDVPGVLALLDRDPDVVVLDIRMPPTRTVEGLEAAAEIRRLRPGQPVLVLSAYVEPAYATRLLAGSADGLGYLLKDRVGDPDELVAAMERLVAGGSVIDPEIVSAMLRTTRDPDPLAGLSARERDVLALMAEGRSNASIAQALVLTERTIETHVRHIFTRLGLSATADDHRRVLAVLAFLRHGTTPER
ncbi:MAG: response regulator transcription factor [Candidatus Nanopelagicales bacterium]